MVPYKGRKFVSEPEHDVSSFAPLLVSESNISTSLGLAMATLKITNWYKIPLAGDAIVVLLADFAKLVREEYYMALDLLGLIYFYVVCLD